MYNYRLRFISARKVGMSSMFPNNSLTFNSTLENLDQTSGDSKDLNGFVPPDQTDRFEQSLSLKSQFKSKCQNSSMENPNTLGLDSTTDLSAKLNSSFNSSISASATAAATASISSELVAAAFLSGDEDESLGIQELEKRIETLSQIVVHKQRAIDECSYRLSGLFLGQDRFYRSYFVLGHLGGIYIESGLEKPMKKHFDQKKDNLDLSECSAESITKSVTDIVKPLSDDEDESIQQSQNSSNWVNSDVGKFEKDDDMNDSENRFKSNKDLTCVRSNCDTLNYFDPNLIVSQIKAYRKLAQTRHHTFGLNGTGSRLINKSHVTKHLSNMDEEFETKCAVDLPNNDNDEISDGSFNDDYKSKHEDNSRVADLRSESCHMKSNYDDANNKNHNDDQKIDDKNLDKFTNELQDEIDENEHDTIAKSGSNYDENTKTKFNTEDQTSPIKNEEMNEENQSIKSEQTGAVMEPLDLSKKLISKPSDDNGESKVESELIDDKSVTTAVLIFMSHVGLFPQTYPNSTDLSLTTWNSLVNNYKTLLINMLQEEAQLNNGQDIQLDSLKRAIENVQNWIPDEIKSFIGVERLKTELDCSQTDDDLVENVEDITDELEKLKIQRSVEDFSFDNIVSSDNNGKWYCLTDLDKLKQLTDALSLRGIRERNLAQSLKRLKEFVEPSLQIAINLGRFSYFEH